MSCENGEQLTLERRPRPPSVEVPDKRVVVLVENDGCVESSAEVLRECCLANAYRTLDGDVTEVQYTRQYSSPCLNDLCML